MKSSLFDLVVPSAYRQTGCIRNRVLWENHSQSDNGAYAFFMSGYSSNRIFALCFCFSVHLSGDLNRDNASDSNSRVSPLGYRYGTNPLLFNLASSISSLAWMAFQRCLIRAPHCIASQFLNVKTVYDATGFWKCRTNDFSHGIGQIKSYFFNCKTFFLVNTSQHSYHIFRFRACHNSHQGFFLVPASPLVTNVYSSPFESDDSSMAILGPMLSGKSSQSSACSTGSSSGKTAYRPHPAFQMYVRRCGTVPQAYGRSLGTSPYVSFKKAPNSLG